METRPSYPTLHVIGLPFVRVIQVPLSATEWATLQAPFPMTEKMWNQMMAVLQAMKPALTKDGEDKDPANDPLELALEKGT